MNTGIIYQGLLRHSAKMNCILMSLKPIFAEEILNGKKKCEIRTYLGKILENDLILIYESKPIKAITGYFHAGKVIITTPHELPKILNNAICNEMPEDNIEYIIKNYMKPKPRKIIIIQITQPTRLTKTITITQLKKMKIKIPRSYTRLNNEKCKNILKE